MSAGLYYNVFDIQAKDKDDNTVKLDVYVNYAFRSIGGDIREEPEILEKAFGSKRYSYHGFEPGLVFSVNSLRLAANFPLFGHSIKGFSNGQFVGNLGFSTALNLTR